MTLRPILLIEKLPAESFTLDVSFVSVLEAGETISDAATSAVDRNSGNDETANVLSGSPTVAGGNTVQCVVIAGEEGKRYLLSIVATLNTGELREQWIEMRIPTRTV